MFAFAVGAAIDTEPRYSELDRFLGIRNISDLFIHVLGLVGVYLLLRSLDGVIEETPISSTARWLSPFLLVAIILSAVLFFATPMPTETSSFTAEYGNRPTIIAYFAISTTFPTLCLVQLGQTVLEHRYNPHAALRRGLKITGVGVIFGFAYAALKLGELITSGAGKHGLATTAHSLDRTLLGAGLLLIGAGFAVSPLANWTKPYRERFWMPGRDRRWVLRSLQRLDWLWRRFCVDAGVIDIIEETDADLSDDEAARFLLIRQVVELRDAQGILWSYLTSEDIAGADFYVRADERSSGEAVMRIEARALAVSLDRQLRGLPPRRDAAEPVPSRVVVEPAEGPLNLRKEVADLIKLSEYVKGLHLMSTTTQLTTPARKRASKLASGVSDTLGPLPPLAALCTAGALQTEVLAGVGWGLLAMFFAAILPYIGTWKMRHPTDGGHPSRRNRAIYNGWAVLTAAVGVAVLIPLGSPAAVVAVAVTIMACLLAVVVPNARWRWSNHMAACAAGCAMLVVLVGAPGLVAAVALPAVAWARLQLGRHTVAELVCGGALGAAVAAVVLPLAMHLG